MLISRTTMKTQLKGNKMPKYKTKGGGKISTKKSISKIGQKLLGMKNIRQKPLKKKNIGGILEQLSPVYGIMKGKGPYSNIASQLGKLGPGLSPIGAYAMDQRNKRKARQSNMEMPQMPRMKMGGQVKRKKSIDGIATKGKTRAI